MSNHILKVKNKTFFCPDCGCNVFHTGPRKGLWVCNGCGQSYGDETYQDSPESNSESENTIFDLITQDYLSLAFVLSELIKMEHPPFNDFKSALSWLIEKVEEEV